MKIKKEFGEHFIVDRLNEEEKLVKPMSLQVEINTWEGFSRVRETLRGRGWIFRGQESAAWQLESGLQRECCELERKVLKEGRVSPLWLDEHVAKYFALEMARSLKVVGTDLPNEKVAIENFKKLTRGKLDCGDSYVENLAAMQHYGSKTRLLDFTYSIYVALFFAFEKRVTGSPRAIWAVRLDRLMSVIKRELYKSARRSSGQEYDKPGVSGPMYHVNLEYENVARESLQMRDEIMLLADKNIRTAVGKRSGILPVQILGNNPRMDVQNGLFLMPRNFRSFTSNLAKSLSLSVKDVADPEKRVPANEIREYDRLDDVVLIKMVFDPCLEGNAWQILEEANVNPRTIYPDIEGIAKSVRYTVASSQF